MSHEANFLFASMMWKFLHYSSLFTMSLLEFSGSLEVREYVSAYLVTSTIPLCVTPGEGKVP